MGGRRYVLGDGGWRIGGSCADSEGTVAPHRTAVRTYSRRGGTCRRQPVDILCLRQGEQRSIPTRRTSRPKGLPRLQGLRRRPMRRPMCRRPMCRRPMWRRPMWRRLWTRLWNRLWRLQLRLLPVVGSLPDLLEHFPIALKWRSGLGAARVARVLML
jgi:hypothetical protein